MKLYQLVLLTLVVSNISTTSPAWSSPTSDASTVTESTTDHEESRLVEDAYQQLLQLDRVQDQQRTYIDGNVQMEMLFGGGGTKMEPM